jgi:hypothetical protein
VSRSLRRQLPIAAAVVLASGVPAGAASAGSTRSASGTAAASATPSAGASSHEPAELSVHWDLSARAGSAPMLTATFAVVAGAKRYTLALVRGRARLEGACHAAGAGRHPQATCAIQAPSGGQWRAEVTAVAAKGVLADASRLFSFFGRG